MSDPVLASDREREATLLRLRAAHLEGRLETDEFEQRVERAQTARTRADLDSIQADLPERTPPDVQPTTGVPWFPGRRPFVERKLLHAPVDQVREAAVTFIVPPLEGNGYLLHQEGDDVLVFTNRHHGDRITVRFRDAGDRRTLVLAHGTAPLNVRRAFARLDD